MGAAEVESDYALSSKEIAMGSRATSKAFVDSTAVGITAHLPWSSRS